MKYRINMRLYRTVSELMRLPPHEVEDQRVLDYAEAAESVYTLRLLLAQTANTYPDIWLVPV